ncbi:MAG: hypothetical protein JW900_06535 [Anaerolineae bacterium]|nr:hypothetical protein [Anaerolineae bacterium]
MSSAVDTNPAAAVIAQALQERGVFPDPATRIAALMAGAGFDVEGAVEVFLAQMADTDNSIPLTVWRLRQGLWEPSRQVGERVGREARRAAWQQYAARSEGDQEQEDDAEAADPSVNTLTTWGKSAAEVWQATLDEVALSTTHATFDTWLRGARLAAYDAGAGLFTVEVANARAVSWLTERLKPLILRALVRLAGQPAADVRFVVAGGGDGQAA